MNYRGRIMNIERDPMLVAGAPTDAAYFYGHRDARHAAAEIASKADAEIDRLRAEIARLVDANRHQDEIIGEQAAEIARLQANSDRYIWMRDNWYLNGSECRCLDEILDLSPRATPARMDAAIDALSQEPGR